MVIRNGSLQGLINSINYNQIRINRRKIETFRLYLVLKKFEGKCEGNKIEKKSRRKWKVKENKKK